MTASEKPESSDSQSPEDANRTSVITPTADDSTASDSAEQPSATADGTQSVSSRTGEIFEGSDAPPPWKRGTTATSSEQQSAPAEAVSKAIAEDTQTIPKHVQDQDTIRTELPMAGATSSRLTRGGQAAPSFQGSTATRAGATTARRPSRGPRRASLQVKRVDPWSVLKLALVLSVALFFVWMIAVAVLYGVLDGMGVWDQLNGTFTELTQPDDAASQPLISAGRVFGVASIIGAINIVLITALATVAAFIYNVAADFAGGIEVTLSERE